MLIDWNAFTPWSALIGGVLIGLAAAMLVLLNGRIAGISGVLGGLLRPVSGDVAWRVAFVLGLVGSPWVYGLVTAWPVPRIDAGYTALVVAGLLVGVGTRYGSGSPVAMAFAGCRACRLARWWPRWLSWRPVS